MKTWLRSKVSSQEQLRRYSLELPSNDKLSKADGRLVVLAHGFNAKPEDLAGLRAAIQHEDYACGSFRYPNDHSLRGSAELLARELRAVSKQHPEVQIAIVAHSMGGLVARECVEDTELDPGNVDRLIMIGTPNQGTLLAHYAIGTDLCEHFLAREGGNPLRRFRAAFADGLGEATHDMTPDSEFLSRLNARGRNANVQYTLFLGTGGKLYDKELQLASRSVRKARHIPGLANFANHFATRIANMEELVAGKGDGAVAVRRGVLADVSDTVILNFEHQSVVGSSANERTREVYEEVLARLALSSSSRQAE
ncbi:MAG: alpha/beta hydrolase [Planctomycetales bacterium]|nr:alpha/beta hydrolase [Planctomycetales bacterium]